METPLTTQKSIPEKRAQEGKRQIKARDIFTPDLIGPVNKRKKPSAKEKTTKPQKKPKGDVEEMTKQKVTIEADADSYAEYKTVDQNCARKIDRIVPEAEKIAISDIGSQGVKKLAAIRCSKCHKLKARVNELETLVSALQIEKTYWLEYRDSLIEENNKLKKEKEDHILAGIKELKKTIKSQQEGQLGKNDSSNTTLCEGVRLDTDCYYKALSATTISARIRKIAAGYWPADKIKYVFARKPSRVPKEKFIKILSRDYENIDCVVQSLQANPKTKIVGFDEQQYLEKYKVWIQKAVSRRREELQLSSEEDSSSSGVEDSSSSGEEDSSSSEAADSSSSKEREAGDESKDNEE